MTTEPGQIDLFYRFGAALLIGLLVGLQREYSHLQQEQEEKLFGGVRTFALLGLLGCTAAFVAARAGSVLAFVVVIAISGGLIMIAYAVTARRGSIGMTSEASAVITVLAGALCYWGELELAAALGVAMTVLLALKLQAQTLVRNITQADVYATLTFAVIALVILPVLPRTSFGPPPFDVLVPYKIWLMVIFISGISFLGYLLIKIVGRHPQFCTAQPRDQRACPAVCPGNPVGLECHVPAGDGGSGRAQPAAAANCVDTDDRGAGRQHGLLRVPVLQPVCRQAGRTG
jgi:hypothetical protein